MLKVLASAVAVPVLLALSAPAAAAPAQHYEYGGCTTFDVSTYCYTMKGFSQTAETRSGVYVSRVKTLTSSSFSEGGTILSGDSVESSVTLVARDGETRVLTQRAAGASQFLGGECSYSVHYVQVKDTLKVDEVTSECTSASSSPTSS